MAEEEDAPKIDLPESIGRYRVVRLVGEGAMGRVLLAYDPVLDREVAIKHLRADLSIPDEVRRGLVKRMQHEARAAARVMHPNLVTLHDMGEDERVGLYLVFEYVEGPTLKERVHRGRLPPAEAARVAEQLGTALTMAHGAGILHRDIKPENVILSTKGAKIADFGIAKIPDSTLTHQGGLMGTPAYSAPETFRTSTFSAESDQFSLAATLYEAVSGRRAFPGDDAVAVAQRILHESADPFAADLDLPEEVDRVFGRALSRRPRERFASCEDFGRALSRALLSPPASPGAGPEAEGGAGSAINGGSAAAATDPPRERRGTHVVLGLLAVMVTVTLLVRTALDDEPADPLPAATGSAPALPSSATTTARPRPTPPKVVPRPPSSAAITASADAGDAPAPDETSTATETAPAGTSTATEAPTATATATATATSDAPAPAASTTTTGQATATPAPTAPPKAPDGGL